MYEILDTVGVRRCTNGKTLSEVAAVCLTCGCLCVLLRQSAARSNRARRAHCQHCVKDTYHNLTKTRIWRTWYGLRTRAHDMNDKNYGGRGIGVSRSWEKFKNFLSDMGSSYADGLTIERVDSNKSYSKSNCRWATNAEQQANKRNNRVVYYCGKKMHLAELCRRSGVSKTMLMMRLNRGMTGDEAVANAKASPYGKGLNAKGRGRPTSTIS